MAAPRVIALDLGGTKLLSGIVDSEGVVRKRIVNATDTSSQEALLEQVDAAVADNLDDGVGAIGIGVPSLVDQGKGEAVESVNIPLTGLPFRDHLRDRFDLPTAIENDGNAAALAEHRYGAGRGSNHMIMLTLGTGIGGGLILDGRLYRGETGSAAELGHITLDLDGPPCQGRCPGRGHLEVLASGTAADALARARAADNPDGDLGRAAAEGRNVDAQLAVELAAHGPGDARDVLEHVGFHLGVGIATLVNIFNPELVVIGGGFARAGDQLLGPARKVVSERALSPSRDQVRIVPALLGVEAGLIGAGLVGFEALERAA
ncbi:MAG TPA: ROK family protein [Gaiellaceae bacterium]|jgi:glucokinase